jgi:hypothetical protein
MEMDHSITLEHHGVTTFVGLGVALLGAAWVTELRPTMQHVTERLQASLGLHGRCIRQRRRPAPHRRMTISSVVPGRVGSIQHREVSGLELATRDLQVDERPIEVGTAQFGHLPRRRNQAQIHIPNDREGVSQRCPDAEETGSVLRSGGHADRVVARVEPTGSSGAVAASTLLGDAFLAQLTWAAVGPARKSGSVSLLPTTVGLGRTSSGPAGSLPGRRRTGGLRSPRFDTHLDGTARPAAGLVLRM